jgi:5-methyltetrahydrofolate--homocysteine methyltransferase
MTESIIDRIRENVIQGRVTQDEEARAQNIDVKEMINEGLTKGMSLVGDKFEAGEYFIPDMLASAEAVGAAMEMLEPHLEGSGIKSKGKILIATVQGDLHDIGKNIVSILLRGAGYTVKDLGNDIEPDAIVAAVREEKPEILGLSALLTSTMAHMEDTINALKNAGIRDSVKVVIGGAPVSEEYADKIGADGYGADGFQAVSVIESLTV